jgi:putative membrane protein
VRPASNDRARHATIRTPKSFSQRLHLGFKDCRDFLMAASRGPKEPTMRSMHAILILAAAGIAACRSDRTTDRSDYRSPARPEARVTTTTAEPAATNQHSPEVRILSILHAKNEEETRLGRLAQDKASADDVKEYGAQLVRDHSELDAQTTRLAQAQGITLLDPHDVSWMLAREKGVMPSRSDSTLETLSGSEFDRAFSEKMRAGHAELITMVSAARSKVANADVAAFLDQIMPRLQHHQQMAQRLAATERE